MHFGHAGNGVERQMDIHVEILKRLYGAVEGGLPFLDSKTSKEDFRIRYLTI